ncbi:hypothetical protein D3C71_1419210 [compost metagenome]
MASSTLICHQSRVTFRPVTKLGLHTRPSVLLVEVSGFRFGFDFQVNGSSVCVAPDCGTPSSSSVPGCTKPAGTPWAIHWASTAPVGPLAAAHGSA